MSLYEVSGIGFSWLELFISFTLGLHSCLGGASAPPPWEAELLDPRASLKSGLESFKKLVRHIVSSKLHPDQRHWFAPLRASAPRLSCLGFGTRLACLAAAPAWSSEHARAVAERILSLRARFREPMVSKLRAGTLALSPLNISLLGAMPWTSRSRAGDDACPASHPGFFAFACRPPCLATHSYVGKPRPAASGAWPQVRCVQCGLQLRVGMLRCCACHAMLRRCSCMPTAAPRPSGRQQLDIRALLSAPRLG